MSEWTKLLNRVCNRFVQQQLVGISSHARMMRTISLHDWLERNPKHVERVLELERRLSAEGHESLPRGIPHCRNEYVRRGRRWVRNPDYRPQRKKRTPLPMEHRLKWSVRKCL